MAKLLDHLNRFFFFCLLVFPSVIFGQSLLVNGGFEDENICSEYKVNCAPEAWIYTIPSYNYYYRVEDNAHGGTHYIGLIASNSRKSYFRTFVRSRLLCALRQGKKYRIDLYVKSKYAVLLDSIGVYFSNYDFLFEKTPYQKIIPSVYFTNAQLKPRRTDTGWQHVSIDYTARGDESFFTLGNFRKLDSGNPGNIQKENNFFVFFDDVTLTPLDPVENLCADWKKNRDFILRENERHEYQLRAMTINKMMPTRVVKTTPTKMLKVDTLVVPDVLFATNSFQLDKKAMLLLDSLGRQRPDIMLDSIVVEGHTDNLGSDAWNEQLSKNRANSVAGYLEYFMNTKVISRGWGSRKPIADNRAPGGRRKNRRVEIYLYLRE